jgi:thiol-disulfide isomerase/thioredoxin
MARKTVKANLSKSAFDIDFDVILVVILIVVAILLICFMNNKFNKQAEKFFTESNTANANNNRVLLFYTTWCPHSQQFLDNDLGRLVSTLENHGKQHLFMQVDISDRDNSESQGLASEYSISTVPTLILELNGQREVISGRSDEDFERLVQRL